MLRGVFILNGQEDAADIVGWVSCGGEGSSSGGGFIARTCVALNKKAYDIGVFLELGVSHGYEVDVAHFGVQNFWLLLVHLHEFEVPESTFDVEAVDVAAVNGWDTNIVLFVVLVETEVVEGERVDGYLVLHKKSTFRA